MQIENAFERETRARPIRQLEREDSDQRVRNREQQTYISAMMREHERPVQDLNSGVAYFAVHVLCG